MPVIEFREELHPRGEAGRFTFSSRQHPRAPTRQRVGEVQHGEKRYRHAPALGQIDDGIGALSQNEKLALDAYLEKSLYGKRSGITGKLMTQSVSPMHDLDHLITRARLSHDVVVYRQVTPEAGVKIDKMKPGQVMRHQQYMSASTSAAAQGMRIYASAGSQGLLAGLHGGDANEVIFGRDTQLIYKGLGDDGMPEFELDHDVVARDTEGLDERVIDVGGDPWNRETAVKLEREYREARPQLEALERDLTKLSAEQPLRKPKPEAWGDFTSAEQKDIEATWVMRSWPDAYAYEVEHWRNGGGAYEDAKTQLSKMFNEWNSAADKPHPSAATLVNTGWATSAVTEYLKEKKLPFRDTQLVAATHFELVDDDHGKQLVDVDIDEGKLQSPQPDDETEPVHQPLEKNTRRDLELILLTAFKAEAMKMQQSMYPPTYLDDSTKARLNERWTDWSDNWKFEWTKENTDYGKHDQPEQWSGKLPEQWDPLGEGSPEKAIDEWVDTKQKPVGTIERIDDYQRTQQVAREMMTRRVAQVMQERGIKKVEFSDIDEMGKDLWDGWKRDSYTGAGQCLQLAIAEELGTRVRTGFERDQVNVEEAMKYADDSFLGGYEAVKAYVRGMWETTQHMLDRADRPRVQLFRALDLSDRIEGMARAIPMSIAYTNEFTVMSGSGTQRGVGGRGKIYKSRAEAEAAAKEINRKMGLETETIVPGGGREKYERLSSLSVDRNGAASTSTDAKICNGWGDDWSRVVLRFDVPRTSIVSVPAYGKNIYGEHECVLIGGAWHGWDAWMGKAPKFSEVPVRA